MKNTSEWLEQFNPKNHPKYSKNIYLWLKNNAKRVGLSWDKVTGKSIYLYDKGSEYLKRFQLHVAPSGRYYIGIPKTDPLETESEYFVGASIVSIRSYGSKTKIASFYDKFTLVDINFWENYKERGVCAIPDSHNLWEDTPPSERWEQIGEYQRKCKWCGHNQILTKWTETKVIEHEQWNDIPE